MTTNNKNNDKPHLFAEFGDRIRLTKQGMWVYCQGRDRKVHRDEHGYFYKSFGDKVYASNSEDIQLTRIGEDL